MRRVGWLVICLPAAAILSVWALAGYSSEPVTNPCPPKHPSCPPPRIANLCVCAVTGLRRRISQSAAELESMGGRRGFVPVGMRRGYASLAGERGEQGGKGGRGRSIRRLHRDTDEGLVESSGGGGKGGGGGGGSGGGGCGAGGWGSHPISCLRHAIGSTSETSKVRTHPTPSPTTHVFPHASPLYPTPSQFRAQRAMLLSKRHRTQRGTCKS
jgi:hypothetical protein